MKLVHLSDLHLGYRNYHRLTASGLNQREADVAAAFKKTIDAVIELRPDVIVVGGDVFHSVRPSTPAILLAYKQFARLREMLPDTIVVVVAGNHDTPRTVETGHIIRLFKELGIIVVDTEPKRLTFRNGELSILAVPSHIRPRPAFEPDASAKYNVLLIHDMVEGVVKRFGPLGETGYGDLKVDELNASQWNYIAFGHYHIYHQVAPNAYYSGSLEYTSNNIWQEIDEEAETAGKWSKGIPGKGFIVRDLDTGAHEFKRISLARRVVDLPAIQGASLSASDLSDAIVYAVENSSEGIENKIVRLVVRDVPRHVLRDIDHRRIREFKRSALHFLLDVRRPQPVRIEASGAPGRRASLIETVKIMLETRDVTPGIDRKSLVDLGMHYLLEADRLAPALSGDEV